MATQDSTARYVDRASPVIALTVRGSSMENPGARPSYSDGDVILVDRWEEPAHGRCVIVVNSKSEGATLAQLVVDGDRKFLRRVNPGLENSLTPLRPRARILGVVIGKRWRPGA